MLGELPELRLTMLVQGDQPRSRLVDLHRKRVAKGETSILIGLQSFAEGLDLKGDLLSQVHIHQIAFPPMAKQLSLRWHMGVRSSAHTLVKLATPFGEREALRLSSVSHPEYVPRVARFFSDIDAPAILLNGTEGEVYANPLRCPAISFIPGAGREAEVWVER